VGMRPALLACVLVSLGAAPAPEAPAFAETRTTADGRTLALTGLAKIRDVSIALYVDELDARRAFPALIARAGGRSRAKLLASDHAQSFVVWGHFTKLAVIRLGKPLTPAEIRELWKPGFDDELDKATPELKKLGEGVLNLFDRELKAGDEIVLRTDSEGRIEVDLAGEKRLGPASPKLARALWSAWLGGKAELRKPLVEKVDLLGR
jgi:hypothetical protein